jgi:hypothetical protein
LSGQRKDVKAQAMHMSWRTAGRARARTLLAVLAAAGLVAVGAIGAAAPAEAGPGVTPATGTGGFNGPTVTHPAAAPEDLAAGAVCAFAVHIDFPVNKVVQDTWTNDAGQPVFATASGLLVAHAVNVATGRGTTVDLDGAGNYSYLPDGSFILSGGGGVLASLHGGDSPPNDLLFSAVSAHSFISVRVATVNGQTVKTVLALSGPHRNLCDVLAH